MSYELIFVPRLSERSERSPVCHSLSSPKFTPGVGGSLVPANAESGRPSFFVSAQ